MRSLILNSKGKNLLKRRIWALVVMFAIVLTLLPAAPTLADSDPINFDDLYQWTGDGIWGTGISGGNGTMKFEMTHDFLAFCVDINTSINTSSNYVKLPLDHTTSVGMFTNASANPDKIRAILTYAWDKTDPDEIAAIQYALWNEMHNTALPNSANTNIKNIFNKLTDDNQTPPISAASVNPNNFTLTPPDPDSQQYIYDPETTEYSFNFEAESGANIVFEMFDSNNDVLTASNYEITNNGSGSYTLLLKNISAPSTYKLEATTLKDTAVDAFVFMSINQNSEEINHKKSQTVAGIKLSETTQSKSFEVNLYYAATGSLDISGTKTLTGRDLEEGEFTFELFEGDDTSGEPFRSATNDADGNFSFATINYTLEDVGSKTYTVIEQSGELSGISYDENIYTVTVTITDNGDGTLTAEPSTSGNNDGIVFRNSYAATGSLDISGTKTLTGRDLEEGEFTFELFEGDDTSGEPFRSATNDADGNFSFATINYILEDVGSKTYTIIEQSGELGGIIYDTNSYTIVVNISDNGDGTLSIDFSETSDDPEDINFINSVQVIIIEDDETPLADPTTAPTTVPTIDPEITIPQASADPTLPTIEIVQDQIPQSGEKTPLWPLGAGLLLIAGGMVYLLNRKEQSDNE